MVVFRAFTRPAEEFETGAVTSAGVDVLRSSRPTRSSPMHGIAGGGKAWCRTPWPRRTSVPGETANDAGAGRMACPTGTEVYRERRAVSAVVRSAPDPTHYPCALRS